MENILKTYVINLKECKNRLQTIDGNLKQFGIKYQVWEATKGRDLSPSELESRTSYLCRNYLCNNGTIGCHMSHLLLWNSIAKEHGDSRDAWFLILEDDAHLQDGFNENITQVFDDMHYWPNSHPFPELIHLSCNVLCKDTRVTNSIFTSKFVNTTRGYMLSAKGATKLSSAFKKVNYHVDMMLAIKYNIFNSIAYYTSNNYVDSNDNLSSTIGAKSFPRLLPDIMSMLLQQVGTTSLHVVYDSPVISINRSLDINIVVILFAVVLGLLVAKRMYIAACVYVLVEVVYFLVVVRSSKSSTC